jgi:NitT/TauT family transport system ATP-binding protein
MNISSESNDGDAPATRGEITLRDVCKSYGPSRFATEVVRDCTFTAPARGFTVIIGPSGVGKSTLIRLIAGFERPTRGEIRIDGARVTGPGRDRLVVFQECALFPWMSVAENALFGPLARGEARGTAVGRVKAQLERVGLSGFSHHFPAQLSGGMQRRAELARALVNRPDVVIMDEPFRGLDALTKTLMLDYYARLSAEQRRTNLFVTTDIDEAIFLADRLLIMGHMPTSVRAAIEVDLPRPRRFKDLFLDDRANAIKMRALALLHEEATKGFAGTRQAAADFVDAYRRRVETLRDGRESAP